MAKYKVEINGINTNNLKVLKLLEKTRRIVQNSGSKMSRYLFGAFFKIKQKGRQYEKTAFVTSHSFALSDRM